VDRPGDRIGLRRRRRRPARAASPRVGAITGISGSPPFVAHLERRALAHGPLEAREKRDFRLFLPHLDTIVALKREEAEYLGYEETAYDALLDVFEPGMTASRLTPLFADLKIRLKALLDRIQSSGVRPPSLPPGLYDAQRQLAFGSLLLSAMGYAFDHGRLDQAAHPFTTGFHPTDVRLTTRLAADDVTSSLFSCLHEGGHGLYDQGLDPAHYGTPLGESVSLGMHESQSRLWENCVGRSIEFWRHFYPLLREASPLRSRTYRSRPSRRDQHRETLVDPGRGGRADLQFPYHGSVRVGTGTHRRAARARRPARGLERGHARDGGHRPRHDGEGVLQDIHWAHGAFGYFPTYTLGNLYAAQFWQQAQRDIADLPTLIEGRLDPLVGWLRDRIHRWGRMCSSDALLRHVTGESVNPTTSSRTWKGSSRRSTAWGDGPSQRSRGSSRRPKVLAFSRASSANSRCQSRGLRGAARNCVKMSRANSTRSMPSGAT
jgi:carboxypeptidase Taq